MNRPQRRDHRRAFTLVELLVVIGIIGILIAILVPVISKVRISAQTAATQNMLVQIGAAIENYHHDFGAYPGATPDMFMGKAPPQGMLTGLTGPESLVLALLGGVDANFATTPPTFTYNAGLVGNGPISFNRLSPGQKQAYMPYRKEQLTPGFCKDDPALSYIKTDSQVPEFIDAYADPEYRPILYLRANPGAINGDATKIVGNTYEAHTHYNLQPIQPYLKTNSTDPTKSDVFLKGAADLTVQHYFSNSFGTARGAGSFLLISAGANHIYGDNDDIIQSGGGGQ